MCSVTSDVELASDLLAARPGEDLFAVFQPQIDLATGSIVAAEVLCRWRHPRLGFVPPDEFIAVAEESGTIGMIGRLMLDEGIDLIDSWRRKDVDIQAAVNVSPLQLTTDEFVDRVRRQLAERALPSHALTIEVTETRPFDEVGVVVHELERLRSSGIGVALDDFGAGHASTTKLEQLPISEVKLDRSLIQSASPDVEATLSETIQLARKRGLRVVAEGIETRSQLRRAVELGCDRVQGYLLSRPLRRSAFDALLA